MFTLKELDTFLWLFSFIQIVHKRPNMKIINYKDSHFNLIIEKDHLLLSKSSMTQNTMNDICNICQKSIETNSTMKEHIEKHHKEELQKCDCKPKEEFIEP